MLNNFGYNYFFDQVQMNLFKVGILFLKKYV